MKRPILIKGLTLTCFTTLIISFILYRTGKFNSYWYKEQQSMQTSHNGGTIVVGKDSVKAQRDTLDMTKLVSSGQAKLPDSGRSREYLSSSKSMIMIEDSSLIQSILRFRDSLDKAKKKIHKKAKHKR